MNKPVETWEQPTPRSGLPWQLILIPLELALVLVPVWWLYTAMLRPRPMHQRTCASDERPIFRRHGIGGTSRYRLELKREETVIREMVEGRQIATVTTGLNWAIATYHDPSKTLAVGTNTGTVTLFNAATDRPLGTIPAHAKGVRELLFSPDGKLLASAGSDGMVRLWDVPTQKLKHQLKDFNPNRPLWPYEFRFSPHGQFLFAASVAAEDRSSCHFFWDTATGQCLRGPDIPNKFVNFVPGTDEVLYREPLADQRERHQFLDEKLKLWDLRRNVNTGTWNLPDLGGKLKDQGDVEVSPDGTKLAYLIRTEAHQADADKSRSKLVVLDRVAGHALLVLPGGDQPFFVSDTVLFATGPDTDMNSESRGQRLYQVWDLTDLGTQPTLWGQLACAVIACSVVGAMNLLWWLLRRRPSPPTVQLVEE